MMLYNKRISARTYTIFSTILLVLQFGISLEIFATFIFFSFLTLIVFYYTRPDARKTLLKVCRYSAASIVLALVVLSPFIYYLLVGLHNLPNKIHPLSPFSTNLANLLIPTPTSLVAGNLLKTLSNHFTANISENGAYIGLPLLLTLLYIFIKQWGNKLIRGLIIVLIIIGIASLGPKLHIISQIGTTIPMPWYLFSKLPLLKSAQPDRFSIYFFLLIAVVLALWLTENNLNKTQVRIRYFIVLVGVLFLIPNPSLYQYSKPEVPAIFQKKNVSKYIPKQDNVLILPFNNLGSGIYYQYASGMAFTQSGGYVGFIPKNYTNSPVIIGFQTGVLSSNFRHQFYDYLVSNQVKEVIYNPNTTFQSVVNIIKSYHCRLRIGLLAILFRRKIFGIAMM